MSQELFIGNSNIITLDALTDTSTGSFLNAATVSVTLLDDQGIPVVGDTWPKAMTYVAASNGRYQAVIAAGISLVEGKLYTAVITAVQGGVTAVFNLICRAVTRGLF